MISVTPLYAGLITLLYIWLSKRTISRRFEARVSIGDGGDKEMEKRIRVHANCAEYAPLGLLLMLLTELQDAPVWVLHLFGLMLLAGRVLHAWGLGSTPQVTPARIGGMVLTFTMLGIAALANIGHALF